MNEKKKKNWFLTCLGILFVIYVCLYVMDNLGYYNIAAKNKVITEEKLQEFEADVKNGKEIDIKEYVRDTTNYRNTYSNIHKYAIWIYDDCSSFRIRVLNSYANSSWYSKRERPRNNSKLRRFLFDDSLCVISKQ